MPMLKHPLPQFLTGKVLSATYTRWLQRKASAHVRRDKKRYSGEINVSSYKDKIHEAVLQSAGSDKYTGEYLDWSLLSKYNNEKSRDGRRAYKAELALLPTVDHVESANHKTEFCIRSRRTNDAKHDLSVESFLDLCVRALKHNGYSVSKDTKFIGSSPDPAERTF